MKLENEFLLVEIAAQGAEVTRIFNKKDETDVLWEGNPVFWCRHSPLLFPYVGKTYQNKLMESSMIQKSMDLHVQVYLIVWRKAKIQ